MLQFPHSKLKSQCSLYMHLRVSSHTCFHVTNSVFKVEITVFTACASANNLSHLLLCYIFHIKSSSDSNLHYSLHVYSHITSATCFYFTYSALKVKSLTFWANNPLCVFTFGASLMLSDNSVEDFNLVVIFELGHSHQIGTSTCDHILPAYKCYY